MSNETTVAQTQHSINHNKVLHPETLANNARESWSTMKGMLALFALLLVALPQRVLASSEGDDGGDLETVNQLTESFESVIAWITGPLGVAVGTLAIIVAIFGMVFKSQRNEPWGKLAIVVVGVFLLINVDFIVDIATTMGATF